MMTTIITRMFLILDLFTIVAFSLCAAGQKIDGVQAWKIDFLVNTGGRLATASSMVNSNYPYYYKSISTIVAS